MTTQLFLRRLNRGRLRQMVVGASSVVAAGLCITSTSPSEIGPFAFYTIVLLLIVNAVLSLLIYRQVIRPIEKLMHHLGNIDSRINVDDYRNVERLSSGESDAFACLAAGVDGVVESLVGRLDALREQTKGNDDLIAALPIALLMLTRDGKIAKILNASGIGTALRGFRVGEAAPVSYWGDENVKAIRATVDQAFSCNGTVRRDLALPATNGGAAASFRITVKKMSDMSALMTVINLTDSRLTVVSDRPEAVEALATARHDRSVLRRMAASVARDGKSAFAALGGLLQLSRASADPKVREFLPAADEAVHRGMNLMNALTVFAGETRLRLACVPAAESLKALLESPKVKALVPANVKLYLSGPGKALPEIDLDADQMLKAVCLLITNAVEAINGNKGRIWVKVEPCTLSKDTAVDFWHSGSLRPGIGVLVSITDDGPGVSDAMSAHLFEPYASSKREGRGIGLPTVLTIADGHAGAVSVKSSAGCGTTVSLFLPASRNTAEELKLMREVAPNGEILLVDDDPTILHTTSLVLRTLRIAAHPASTEADAVAKLRTLRSRLRAVLIDARLNGTSSTGLVRMMHDEFPQLPVIVVSGSPEENIARSFAGLPYDKFLAKPYTATELLQALETVSPRK